MMRRIRNSNDAATRSTSCWTSFHSFRPLLLGWLLVCLLPVGTQSQEKLTYDTLPFTPNVTHRQDFCGIYQQFRDGKIELRDALVGAEIHPLMSIGDFFGYTFEDGINPQKPGLTAELMDELAQRAGFTWRQSFGVMRPPEELNVTWTEMLLWAVETYDIAVNWWDHSIERLEKGVAYIEPWFDGSLILIDKEDPIVEEKNISLFNWLRPFELSVWILTVVTIIISSFVYQIIEKIHDEREERSIYQWFSDNMYLSFLNFTQNFEYAPNSTAGRIFAVSMALWALIMTATYTANLASLFVDQSGTPLIVDSIEQAITLGIPICTYGNTNSDSIIKGRYEKAKRIPKVSELEAYKGLQRGECGLVAGYLDNWLGYRGDTRYNPDCDLEWVGRTIQEINSGFAMKADAGHLCTSFIRDVLNLHMTEMINDKVLDDVWETHRSKFQDIDCDAYDPTLTITDEESRRLGLTPDTAWKQRKLKGGNAAAASIGAGADPSSSSLTLQQMLGTFVLHWCLMIFAIAVSLGTDYYEKREKDKLRPTSALSKLASFRTYGPIIGNASKPNPFEVRNPDETGNGVDGSSEDEVGHNTTGRFDSNANGSAGEQNGGSLFPSYSRGLGVEGGDMSRTANQGDASSIRQLQHEFQEHRKESAKAQNELRQSQAALESAHRELSNKMDLMVSMLKDMKNTSH